MRYFYELMLVFSMLLSACSQTKDSPMTNQLLTITAKCKGNDKCLYEGKDLLLEISIKNEQSAAVGFPLTYRQKTGPSIRLMDTRTKAEAYLKTNLADSDLRSQFTSIAPGQSVLLEWVITNGELEQFLGTDVNVVAEITVQADVQSGGKLANFKGADTIRIVGKKRPKSN
jgi:hypothetical protein